MIYSRRIIKFGDQILFTAWYIFIFTWAPKKVLKLFQPLFARQYKSCYILAKVASSFEWPVLCHKWSVKYKFGQCMGIHLALCYQMLHIDCKYLGLLLSTVKLKKKLNNLKRPYNYFLQWLFIEWSKNWFSEQGSKHATTQTNVRSSSVVFCGRNESKRSE